MNELIKSLQQTITCAQQDKLSARITLTLVKLETAEYPALSQDLINIQTKLNSVNLTDIQLIEIETALSKINRLM